MNLLHRIAVTLFLLAAASAFLSAQSTARASGGTEVLSCSPAPCVLPATQASQGPYVNVDAPIAANPINPNNLILGTNDYNCGGQGYEGLGFYISQDGGSGWDEYCSPDLSFNGKAYSPISDPILGYDHNGVAYIAGFYGGVGALEAFQKSNDGGVTWSAPAVAIFRNNAFPYHCWMAVDDNIASPYVNSVYMSCVMHSARPLKYQQVVVSHSRDGGATWRLAAVAPRQNISEAQDMTTAMSVGKDGAVYVTWQYCFGRSACQDNSTAYILVSKSTDGGATWTKPIVVASVVLQAGPPSTAAAIAVDNSNGTYSGNLYVSIGTWTGSFQQVQVVRSTDGGNTWSKPVAVAPGFTHDQFLPWISVSSAGLVGVSWDDRRNDPNNVEFQPFAAISRDGGQSFQPNVELTSMFSSPNAIGDYNGATWDGSNYYLAAWNGGDSGANTQDYVGGIRLK